MRNNDQFHERIYALTSDFHEFIFNESAGFVYHTLRWRHNECDSVSHHQPHGCLLNGLLWRRSKKTSKLRVTGLCVGNSPGPVNSPHKGPVTRKMFPFDDVIMYKKNPMFATQGRVVLLVKHIWSDVFLEDSLICITESLMLHKFRLLPRIVLCHIAFGFVLETAVPCCMS